MNSNLTLGSLFDGSGGFPLGALLSGITPVWASEIEPFPIRVTTKRLPFMKHYGDVSKMDGGKIEPVDIITFGSPCQDMSIAGKRAGLDGSRSNLFYEAIRIIKEMRCATDGAKPRYIVWENVTGAFSSNKGQDFKSVLEAVIGIVEPDTEVPSPFKNKWPYADCYVGNGWSVAYRTFDAQYWGVPQRRKRIYLVADFNGGSAWKVLFKSEGLSRYSAESFRAWQKAAGGVETCTNATGFDGYNGSVADKASTIGINCGISTGRNGVMVLNDQGGERMDFTKNITSTLRAEAHHPPCVLESAEFCTEYSEHRGSKGYKDDVSPTLRGGTEPVTQLLFENHNQDVRCNGPLKTSPTITSTYGTGGNNQPLIINEYDIRLTSERTKIPRQNIYKTDVSRTIDTGGNYPTSNQGGVAIVTTTFSQQAYDEYIENKTSSSLTASGGTYGGGSETLISSEEYIVRRLTPKECARLQGFPDWWCSDLGMNSSTDKDISFWRKIFETHRKVIGKSKKAKSDKQIIKWLKNPYSDSAEYKMWGNGVALPNVYFVLAGIVYYSKLE